MGLIGDRRAQNILYEVAEGQTWTFFDAEDEGLVEWLVERRDGDMAHLVKRTGRDPGFRTVIEVEAMKARRWKPLTSAQPAEVLWTCPSCGKANPIAIGDYVCIDCRARLDR